MYEQDTIAAIATPSGEGAVAIVRVSGPDAERIATSVFVRAQGKNGKLASHRLYHGQIQDPRSNKFLDEVLLVVMRKPRSYTGEDIVEVHCHGGTLVVRRVLELMLSQGARHAERGEFTKRAFLNGRLDLAQAEAVLDLIDARTDKGVELALDQVGGGLSKWMRELREELLAILVQIEAAIDFPEEQIELLQRQELIVRIDDLRHKISDILTSYEWGRLFREGAKVCICGRPNVGKSSLLNALLGEDRVIVTDVPGTTRDVIEESINLDGLPVVLWDTAGIGETDDRIEQIGVNLSRRYLEKSDAALVVLDGSESFAPADLALLESLNGKNALIVINKSDLSQGLDVAELKNRGFLQSMAFVSAKTGSGIDGLKAQLRNLIAGCAEEPPVVLTNIRHKAALARSDKALSDASVTLAKKCPPELVAVELSEAREALEEIIGLINNDDILESIFKNFCLGK
ncbi:MAG: tRNA uridine-5-carboxymethylaminomethyl(34) synthesis GTPase MnmE [Deltaproteobacteria bacterium]|nr:tRNA uridine-5-carboxymethylaminomethyl(34) synthesis GTPase MnmE [Deltaproteobacteria bacterium]